MSPGIKQELLLWNYGRILRKVLHFKGAPDIFIAQFAELATQNLIGPKDTISHHQQHGDGFYVLTKGEVIFLRPALDNARLHQTGRAKDVGHWNDRLLIFDSPSDHTVLAVTFVETYFFPGEPVRAMLKRFPDGEFGIVQQIKYIRDSTTNKTYNHTLPTIPPSLLSRATTHDRSPPRRTQVIDVVKRT